MATPRDKTRAKARERRATKTRAIAQKNGDAGELAFAAKAVRHGLIPQQFQNDYGFDFICQLDEDVQSRQPSRLGSQFVAVSVRTTDSADGRITLDRSDADSLLRCAHPVLVALVKLDDGGGDEVHVRVLDADFRKELGEFLQSKYATRSYTPDSFVPIADIDAVLAPALRPGFVQRTRIAATIAGLEPEIAGLDIRVTTGAEGPRAIVTAPDLFSLFDGEDGPRDARFVTSFGAPARMPDRLAELGLNRRLRNELDELADSLVVVGGTQEVTRVWTATNVEGQAACSLTSVHDRGHTGWRHAAGWSLVISDRVPHEGRYVHELQAFIDPDETTDLAAEPELDSFLRHCTGEARLGLVPGEPAIDVETVGDLQRQAWFAQCLADARSHLPEGETIAYLQDIDDEETARTLLWLSNLHQDPEAPTHTLGFVLDVQGGPRKPDQPRDLQVPVLLNTKRAGLTVLLQCSGQVALNEVEEHVGLQIDRVTDFTVDVGDRLEKTTIYPEFVISPEIVIAAGDQWEFITPDADYEGICVEVEPPT